MKFEGIYTPAITPLSADGSIDTQAFAEVLEFLVESKVHGIVIGGSTGEYYAHTAEERLALAAHASEVIAGRLPLVVGTGAIRTEDSLAYAEAARALALPLVAQPELLEQRTWAAIASAWWWKSRGLNDLADQGRFEKITLRINGSFTGAEDRNARLAMARQALGGD